MTSCMRCMHPCPSFRPFALVLPDIGSSCRFILTCSAAGPPTPPQRRRTHSPPPLARTRTWQSHETRVRTAHAAAAAAQRSSDRRRRREPRCPSRAPASVLRRLPRARQTIRPLSASLVRRGAERAALCCRASFLAFVRGSSLTSLSRSSSVSSLTPTLHSVVSTRALSRRQAAAPPPLSGLLKAVERGTTKSTMIRSGTDGMADVRALARAKKGQMCRTVAINYYVGCSCR